MPVSRLNSRRRAKALRYGAKDAAYQLKLGQYRQEKALGYVYPRYAPVGGNGDREYRRTARNFGRPTLFLPYAPHR